MHVTHKKAEKKSRTTKSEPTAYNREGFGMQRGREGDKNWYYKDPITEVTHGPFFSRDNARDFIRKLKADRKKQAEQGAQEVTSQPQPPWRKRA